MIEVVNGWFQTLQIVFIRHIRHFTTTTTITSAPTPEEVTDTLSAYTITTTFRSRLSLQTKLTNKQTDKCFNHQS